MQTLLQSNIWFMSVHVYLKFLINCLLRQRDLILYIRVVRKIVVELKMC